MSASRKLMLDPTGRFIAEPGPVDVIKPPRCELRQLLAPLERICGN